MQVGNVAKLIFKELLPNPAERTVFRRPWLPRTVCFRLPRAGTGQKSQSGIERLAVLVERSRAIPQVIGIIDFEAPSLALAGPNIALATRGPRSEEHTSELQSRPHLVCRLLLEK